MSSLGGKFNLIQLKKCLRSSKRSKFKGLPFFLEVGGGGGRGGGVGGGGFLLTFKMTKSEV